MLGPREEAPRLGRIVVSRTTVTAEIGMIKYDADRPPDPKAWLALEEDARIDLVSDYHRRHHRGTPRIRLHSTFHVIVENQLAEKVDAVVQTLVRLQSEGLTRHEAIHAVGSVLAGQVFELLKTEPPGESDPNEAYAARLRVLTAATWRAG